MNYRRYFDNIPNIVRFNIKISLTVKQSKENLTKIYSRNIFEYLTSEIELNFGSKSYLKDFNYENNYFGEKIIVNFIVELNENFDYLEKVDCISNIIKTVEPNFSFIEGTNFEFSKYKKIEEDSDKFIYNFSFKVAETLKIQVNEYLTLKFYETEKGEYIIRFNDYSFQDWYLIFVSDAVGCSIETLKENFNQKGNNIRFGLTEFDNNLVSNEDKNGLKRIAEAFKRSLSVLSEKSFTTKKNDNKDSFDSFFKRICLKRLTRITCVSF